jgi:hypothetical protein
MGRQSRRERRAGVNVSLTSRDQALLRALARFRIARSSDLGRLFFPGRNRDVLAARLRRLYDTRFLEVHVLDRAAENVYSLGRAGKVWLKGFGMPIRSIPRPPWLHHLAIVRIWSGVAAATRTLEGARLARFSSEWELREGEDVRFLGIVPDALVEILRGPHRIRMALEVDCGTESMDVLREKLRRYGDLRAGGGLFEWKEFELLVALQGAGVRRERAIQDLLRTEWAGGFYVWTEGTDVAAALGQTLKTPVTDSRSGNGREEDEVAGPAEGCSATGGGPSEYE